MSASPDNNPVLFETHGNTATITLNRPKQLNAMNNELMSGISAAIEQVRANTDIRAVIITGAGRGFCAGADLVSAADGGSGETENDTDAGGDVFNPAIVALHECPVPTIARVNGAAAGGGFGLALACDITIAARSAFFVATFGPRLGIVPDMGVTWNLPLRAGRARALGISLLGDRISAEQALAWGLIWDAVDDDQLDTVVANTAARLARLSPAAASRIRHTVNAALQNSLPDQLELEMVHQRVLIPRNMQEGARAFVEKREPSFDSRRDDPRDLLDA